MPPPPRSPPSTQPPRDETRSELVLAPLRRATLLCSPTVPVRLDLSLSLPLNLFAYRLPDIPSPATFRFDQPVHNAPRGRNPTQTALLARVADRLARLEENVLCEYISVASLRRDPLLFESWPNILRRTAPFAPGRLRPLQEQVLRVLYLRLAEMYPMDFASPSP